MGSVGGEEQGIPSEIDWENLFQSITDSIDPFTGDLNFSPEPFTVESHNESVNSSPIYIPSWIDNVEQFLLDDVVVESAENQDICENFFSDIFLDSPSDGPSDKDVALNGEIPSPEVTSGEEKGKDAIPSPETDSSDDNEDKETSGGSEEKETIGEVDDQMSKKRKRQMRNRDSAMKSRERKKLYVRDLELKSRYLEGECKRLGYALQCCVAENQILQQRLHKEKGLGVCGTKQESAVLRKESLLLDSLFWLIGIMCLLLLPCMGLRMVMGKAGSPGGGSKGLETIKEVRQTGNEGSLRLRTGLVHMKRQCKATRTKMKMCLGSLLAFCPWVRFPLSLFFSDHCF